MEEILKRIKRTGILCERDVKLLENNMSLLIIYMLGFYDGKGD